MQLARDGKIILNLDDTVETNHISTKWEFLHHPGSENTLDLMVE